MTHPGHFRLPAGSRPPPDRRLLPQHPADQRRVRGGHALVHLQIRQAGQACHTTLRMRRLTPLPLGGALRRQRPRGHLLRLRGGQGAAEPGRHHRPPTVLRLQVQNAGRQARASAV